MANAFYTIGHARHAIADFVALLAAAGVDIRHAVAVAGGAVAADDLDAAIVKAALARAGASGAPAGGDGRLVSVASCQKRPCVGLSHIDLNQLAVWEASYSCQVGKDGGYKWLHKAASTFTSIGQKSG